MDVLASAPLWWVSRDMTALALDIADNGPLPPPVAMPTSTGLLVYEGGLTMLLRLPDCGVRPLHTVAMTWQERLAPAGSAELPDMVVHCYSDSAETRRNLIDRALPFAPIGNIKSSTDHNLTLLLRTTMALMMQPALSRTMTAEWDTRTDGPRPRSFDAPDRARTTMIVLRRQPPAPHGDEAAGTGRGYSCRFVVRGFYRQQAYGPDHSLRRRQWIPPYVKGPEDAPLSLSKPVRIWRRK